MEVAASASQPTTAKSADGEVQSNPPQEIPRRLFYDGEGYNPILDRFALFAEDAVDNQDGCTRGNPWAQRRFEAYQDALMSMERDGLPDHKTTADFRKDNGPALRQVCARFVELCRQMGLLGAASVAIF